MRVPGRLRQMFLGGFVNRTDMFARFMSRTIAGRFHSRIVRLGANCECMRMSFVSFASREFLSKLLTSPESHRHEPRYIKGGASRGDRADDPEQPANWH